jgi:two-component system KDP operon response regulator KdpE
VVALTRGVNASRPPHGNSRSTWSAQPALLREVWGPQYQSETHYLRQYMARPRRKLEADPAHPRHLISEPGMGYRFRP